MNDKVGIGKSHSKLILMGEHSVVYGYPAIALPLRSIEVVCRVQSSEVPLTLDKTSPLSVAIFAAIDYLGEVPLITYEVESMVPEGRGMGSSAAVAIAGIRAVFDYYGQELSDTLLEDLANRSEEVAHDNPSGLDVKTCLSDTAIRFVRGMGFTTMDFVLNAYLVIADSGVHGRTKEAVAKVRHLADLAKPHLSSLGDLVRAAEQVLSPEQLNDLGRLLSEAHTQLQALGVSNHQIDRLVEEALAFGALGAKMTGGGLGGCLLALVSSQEQANRLARRLEEKGAVKTWIESL